MRAAVLKEIPVRPLVENVQSTAALIVSVVPFGEIRVDYGLGTKSDQLACRPCAPSRARKHVAEVIAVQPFN